MALKNSKLGMIIDEEHTNLLVEASVMSGRSPGDLVHEAIRQWHKLYAKLAAEMADEEEEWTEDE